MKKTIALRMSFEMARTFKATKSNRIALSLSIPRCIEFPAKIKLCRQYFKQEKNDIVERLTRGQMSLGEARLSYNSLLQDITEYLKELVLPDEVDDKEGVFITITGSVANNQASFNSDFDMDIFTYPFSKKKGKRLFKRFSSALKRITGHKVEPIFKNIANFEAQHQLSPSIKYLWSMKVTLLRRLIFSLLKRLFRLFYGSSFFKAERCGPIRALLKMTFTKLHDFLTNLLGTDDIEFYKEYFLEIIPKGFHPHKLSLSPFFFWGDKDAFLYLFPEKHLIKKETSASHKLAIPIPTPSSVLESYFSRGFKEPFKTVYWLFPTVPLLGYLLGLECSSYEELESALRSNELVNEFLGTEFIDSYNFFQKFRFALSVYKTYLRKHSEKDSTAFLLRMMDCSSEDELLDQAIAHLSHTNEVLGKIRATASHFFRH